MPIKFCPLFQHNSQFLLVTYYSQNYASIILSRPSYGLHVLDMFWNHDMNASHISQRHSESDDLKIYHNY